MATQVWTYRELIDFGKTRGEIQRGLRSGRLTRLFHGVYTTAKPTARIIWEALDKVRPAAVLDGKSVIELYQRKQLTLPLHARVPTANLRPGSRMVVQLRRCRRGRSELKNGYRVVPLADAIASCLDDGSVPESQLRDLVEMEYRSESGMRRIRREIAALATRAKLKLKRFFDHCIAGTDSNLEMRFVAGLRQSGFKTAQNVKVAGYKWDVEIRGLKVLIDVDSRHYHGNGNSRHFILDRWKTNEAQSDGWTALRVTDECVDYHLPDMVKMLKQIEAFRRNNPRKRLRGLGVGPAWTWHQVLMGF